MASAVQVKAQDVHERLSSVNSFTSKQQDKLPKNSNLLTITPQYHIYYIFISDRDYKLQRSLMEQKMRNIDIAINTY